MKYHCFFEQSGTFKNEFKKLGYEAYDYDILNDFNETDYVIDLFNEIEKGYLGLNSIFDKLGGYDTIIAFFPCTRFEAQILLNFRGENSGFKSWNLRKKLSYDLKLHDELNRNYSLITKLAIICIDKKIPLIIENSYGEQHYLKRYWCIRPKVIDMNRRENGDYYIKPTQYFFINCEPKQNVIFEPLEFVERKKIKDLGWASKKVQIERSMIHPQYARRFIKEYIIDEEVVNNEL